MRKLFVLCTMFLLVAAPGAFAQEAEETAAPAPSLTERASYVIGYNLGKSLVEQDVAANPDDIIQGLKDGLAGEGRMSDEEIRTTMQEFQQQLMAKAQEKAKELGEKNQKEGAEFLAKNKEKEGVQVTESGLQYEVLEAGDGPSPDADDRVTVHYRGTLVDGTTFDSSYERGQPATFPVNGVISGWTEALQLMNVGSKWKLYLPSDLAYGERGAGAQIGPHAVLVFEVELLGIEGDENAAANGEADES